MAQSAQLGQQGPEYGQYGSQPINQQSPFDMNLNANDNNRANVYNNTMNIPSPQLPVNTSSQGTTWYPGMYPSTQPRFGTSSYSPQTFNPQGHPGTASVPQSVQSMMPNQGQLVKQMATGGTSNLFSSLMPKTASASTIQPVVINKFSPSQEAITHPSTLAKNLPISGKFPGVAGILFNSNKDFSNVLLNGKGASATPQEPSPPPPPPQPTTQVYQPTYAQYAPVNRIETDSYGNPLFNNGGLTSIRR